IILSVLLPTDKDNLIFQRSGKGAGGIRIWVDPNSQENMQLITDLIAVVKNFGFDGVGLIDIVR
ncbi:23654_t:CDS:1, partial [Gigaspora margarita]